MKNIVNGLGTFVGRDSCVRVTSYFALFLYGLLTEFDLKSETGKTSTISKLIFLFIGIDSLDSVARACLIISKQFALTRLITRFFDDIPAIYNLLNYLNNQFFRPNEIESNSDANNNNKNISNRNNKRRTNNKKNQHPYVKWVTVINLLFWVLYNPFEHLGWLAELKIINADDQLWYFYTNVAWAGGLFTSVLLNLRVVILFYTQASTKAKREDDPKYDSSAIISYSEMQQSALVAFRDFLDWCIAIHFMPAGFLWSAQLYYYQVGIIGTISSLCRVHTYVINRQE